MSNNNAVKINMGGIPKTPASAALRLIGPAIVYTNLLIGLLGTVSMIIPTPISFFVGAGMALGSGAAAKPSLNFKKSLEYQAKLMDIKGLLAQRDMAALQAMFNRTRKVKNLLDPYETWNDVPPDLKKSIAIYIDDYYQNIGQLQQALYLAQAQYNKRVEKETAEARKQKGL